ncbi:hypothetical protein PV08_06713 [Exophiala spinifera]|uniref:Uncharacterized protein n=1 Tax=Exophiala spinifera TaxID=91928 RepID=A0A0D1ZM77_9EURO|nr:uncharacterized protein PV08_06713 [Exophiala spinifera]KIW13932.1 hypothetical protein PV08_06713 [Exophiala spinifera]
MSANDPNWPVGYPYVAMEAFTDRGVDLPKDTKGKITQKAPGGWVHVTMPYAVPQRKGWVPAGFLKIGTTRKYGDVKIDTSSPSVSSHPPPIGNSLLTEGAEGSELVWTKLQFPDKNLVVYQRMPVQIQGSTDDDKRITIVVGFPAAGTLPTRVSFEPGIPGHVNLPLGTRVWPVVEMMMDGTPHPNAWARLPGLGPWHDWDRARSWALRIEFQLNDQWQSLGLVSTEDFQPRLASSSSPGAFDTYARGIAMERYLTRIQLNPEHRAQWMYDYGVARVKEQKLEWLTQTITVTDVPSPARTDAASPLKTMIQMQNEYAQLGINAFGTPGQSDRESGRIRQPPRACDSCYLATLSSREIDPTTGNAIDRYPDNITTVCVIKQFNDPNQRDSCERCLLLHRPCTYSRAIEDCPLDTPMVRALLAPREAENQLRSIPDPEISVHRASLG